MRRSSLPFALLVVVTASACHKPPRPPKPGPPADERAAAVASCEGWVSEDDRDDVEAFADFDPVESSDALVGLSEPTTLYFGCGDHAFHAIEAANDLTIVVVGDTRLWIDGDIDVSGPFEIQLEEGATLDLYVGGRFVPTNTVTMGHPDDATALRMWVGQQLPDE